MSFDEKTVEIIEGIGLTSTEAIVYLNLVMLGKAKARTIWKNAGVARQDVYRILSELQGKGLVEKLIAIPTEYKAIPIEDGISILLKHKAQEYKKLAKKTEEGFAGAPDDKLKGEKENEDPRLVTIHFLHPEPSQPQSPIPM